MMHRLIYLAVFILFAANAQASVLSASLSEVIVEKDLSFKGVDITVKGERTPGDEIAILLLGPSKAYKIIKKEKFYGMWLNSKQYTLPFAHSYYRMAASKNLGQIANDETLRSLGFQLNNNDCFAKEPASPVEIHDFCNAFYKYKVNSGLYETEMVPIFTTENSHFKGTFNVPQSVPTGIYHVHIFSFNKHGKLTDKTQLYFLVRNGKVFQTLADFATNYPLTHSLLAITFALTVGGLVGLMFNGKPSRKNEKSDYPVQS